MVLTVTLEPAASETVTVAWTTEDGLSEAGENYLAGSGTLSFEAGQTEQSITVDLVDNTTDWVVGKARFRVVLSAPVNASLTASPLFANVFITDDDDPPTASIADVAVAEDAGTLTFALTLSHPSTVPIGYRVRTGDGEVGGTATSGTDYTIPLDGFGNADIVVPAGSMSASIAIAVHEDAAAEADETIELWISGTFADPPLATPEELFPTGTILDNDPPAPATGVAVTPGNTELTVGWNAADFAGGYKVQWKSGTETFATAATDGREAVVSGGATTSHTITGLANGTAYTVRARALPHLTGRAQALRVCQCPRMGLGIMHRAAGGGAALGIRDRRGGCDWHDRWQYRRPADAPPRVATLSTDRPGNPVLTCVVGHIPRSDRIVDVRQPLGEKGHREAEARRIGPPVRAAAHERSVVEGVPRSDSGRHHAPPIGHPEWILDRRTVYRWLATEEQCDRVETTLRSIARGLPANRAGAIIAWPENAFHNGTPTE